MLKILYCFRGYQLDPKYRELRRDGQLVALPLKSFECLAYLIEHRDRAVGRDELIAAVWGSADINDHTLAQTLSRVRQVLRDADGDTTSIRTVPRFGYCWVAPTERVEVDVENRAGVVPDAPVQSEPSALVAAPIAIPAAVPVMAAWRRRAHSWQRPWFIALVAFIVLAMVAGGIYRSHVTRANSPRDSAAGAAAPVAGDGAYLVMPVLMAADTQETAWIRLGVMDYIGVALKEGGARRVLPNEQTLSLTAGVERTSRLEGAELSRLMALTGATHVMQAHAQEVDGSWRFVLDVFHGDALRSYSGAASTPLEAVRVAVQPMLRDLGLAGSLASLSQRGETLQRIDAALLVGDLAQAQQLLDASAALAAANPAFRQRAGQLALRRGHLDEARQLFRALINGDPATMPRELRVQAWLGLGGVELQRPDFPAAEKAFADAIALLGDNGDEQLLGNAYLGRGTSYVNRSRFEEAMTDFGRARVALDRAGDRLGIARLDIDMAAADAYRGRLPQALEAQDRAIGVLTAFGARDQLLIVLHNRTQVQLRMMDLPGAAETSREAFEQASQFDNELMRARIAATRTRVLLAMGQLTEAGRLIDRFDTGGAAGDSEFVELRLEWLLEQGNYARTADLALESMDRIAGAEGLASQVTLPWACLAGVEAALRVGRIDLAERLVDRLVRAPAAERDADRSMLLDLSRAELLQARGRAADSRALFAASLATAERDGDPGQIIAVASMALRHLLGERDLEAAAPIAGRLKGYAEKDYTAARVLFAYYRASGQSALADEVEIRVRALAGERDPRLPL